MSPLGISCILLCRNIAWKNWNPGRYQPRHSYATIYSVISYQFPSVQLYNKPASRKAVLLWLLLSFFFSLEVLVFFFVIILFTWLVYIYIYIWKPWMSQSHTALCSLSPTVVCNPFLMNGFLILPCYCLLPFCKHSTQSICLNFATDNFSHYMIPFSTNVTLFCVKTKKL